jgi:DNA-binding MarR family transcriptional regulator
MLTEKGMELQHVLGSARDKAEAELVKGLDEEQQALLKQCLRQVLSNLEAET